MHSTACTAPIKYLILASSKLCRIIRESSLMMILQSLFRFRVRLLACLAWCSYRRASPSFNILSWWILHRHICCTFETIGMWSISRILLLRWDLCITKTVITHNRESLTWILIYHTYGWSLIKRFKSIWSLGHVGNLLHIYWGC